MRSDIYPEVLKASVKHDGALNYNELQMARNLYPGLDWLFDHVEDIQYLLEDAQSQQGKELSVSDELDEIESNVREIEEFIETEKDVQKLKDEISARVDNILEHVKFSKLELE